MSSMPANEHITMQMARRIFGWILPKTLWFSLVMTRLRRTLQSGLTSWQTGLKNTAGGLRPDFPNETALALDLFEADFETESYKANGFYARDDFF